MICGPPVTQGVQLSSLDAPRMGGAAMAEYRFYPIQKDGHLLGPPRIMDLSDNDAAIKAAKGLTDERPLEIWQGARKVVRVDPPSR